MPDLRMEAACNQAAVQIMRKPFSELSPIEQAMIRKQTKFILAAADSHDPLRHPKRLAIRVKKTD